MTHYIIDKRMERILKSLANSRRLAILSCLKEKKAVSVGEVAAAIHLSVKATSKHLGLLFSAELVLKQQKSLTVFYRLNRDIPSYVKTLLSSL